MANESTASQIEGILMNPHQLMRYPARTPTVFSGAKRFVEENGVAVWCDLCDTVMPEEWFSVSEVAVNLESLRNYRNPERYLRAVLKAVIADYAERPDEYALGPPVKLRGRRLDIISI